MEFALNQIPRFFEKFSITLAEENAQQNTRGINPFIDIRIAIVIRKIPQMTPKQLANHIAKIQCLTTIRRADMTQEVVS
jgi:hypothetical protein